MFKYIMYIFKCFKNTITENCYQIETDLQIVAILVCLRIISDNEGLLLTVKPVLKAISVMQKSVLIGHNLITQSSIYNVHGCALKKHLLSASSFGPLGCFFETG